MSYPLDQQARVTEKSGGDGTIEIQKTPENGHFSRKNRLTYLCIVPVPDAFQVKKSDRDATVAEDPFSKERSFDLPKGNGMKIRRSSKSATTFVEVKTDREEYKGQSS